MEGDWIKDVQMDNLQSSILRNIKGIPYVPVRELWRVKEEWMKGLLKVFSGGFVA